MTGLARRDEKELQQDVSENMGADSSASSLQGGDRMGVGQVVIDGLPLHKRIE